MCNAPIGYTALVKTNPACVDILILFGIISHTGANIWGGGDDPSLSFRPTRQDRLSFVAAIPGDCVRRHERAALASMCRANLAHDAAVALPVWTRPSTPAHQHL
ncbi:hypothetical protein TW95_gp0219 [Pandoravirus inopinatum]|uniref:Uncharacterized protein n=1 Tax=Pandoravirus inopinatum TaxID=1605721 RepID=A0A0B5IW88_9VIRU|nr:hypothetical protein TW95_gp0219 [Pandoravirus inopinatum]AJF96953.1 hypothetical protein [Pandoravirus inopinatum]